MSWPATTEHLIHGKGQQTAIISQGIIKVHTSFPAAEMIEEYHLTNHDLMTRRIRQRTALGSLGQWTTEVGEQVQALDKNNDFIMTSNSNPTFSRHDSSTHFIFRIRPIPYPSEIYSVTVDPNSQQIVVATSNKKYYKRIEIPEMVAINKAAKSTIPSANDDNKMNIDSAQDGVLDPASLTWEWNDSTLTIQYVKPACILALEAKYKEVLKNAK